MWAARRQNDPARYASWIRLRDHQQPHSAPIDCYERDERCSEANINLAALRVLRVRPTLFLKHKAGLLLIPADHDQIRGDLFCVAQVRAHTKIATLKSARRRERIAAKGYGRRARHGPFGLRRFE